MIVLEIRAEKNEHFGIKSLRQLADWAPTP